MKLKLKYPDSTKIVTLSAETPKLSDLIKLSVNDEIDIEAFKVGFPPKSIPLADDSATLASLGIVNNDQVIVVPKSKSNATSGSKPALPVKEAKPAPAKKAIEKSDASFDSGPLQNPLTINYKPNQYLSFYEIPDDNSCLFRAIEFSILGSWSTFHNLREIVAATIESNSEVYSDAILGKKRQQYIDWILKPTSWGGAIELQILAEYFGVAIWSLDISGARIDKFNPGQENYIVLIYSGIHYDSVALKSDPYTQDIVTVFQQKEYGYEMEKKVLDLGKLLKDNHYYTDTSQFTLKCNDCGTALVGEKEALAHAKKTHHTNFGEY